MRLLGESWAVPRAAAALFLLALWLDGRQSRGGHRAPGLDKVFGGQRIGKRQVQLLVPLVLAILAATAIQGLTSFTLTQLLSKAAQRMIADLRRQVQAHIGRLPVAFHDANKTGALVTRIMSDVEGLRNLVGTGLVEFVGSVMTALFALVFLLRISAFMTVVASVILLGFAIGLNKAIGTIRPVFRARSKLNAEVTGRLTESLAGVRVVKGYHAEEREEQVFAGGVQRLLDNVLKTLTATSLMSLSATVLFGLVSALIMYLGTRRILAHTMTLGEFFTYVAFLAMLVAPVSQIVSIGTQLTEGMAGLERTTDLLSEKPEDADPKRTVPMGGGARRSGVRECGLRLHRGERSPARCELSGAAGRRRSWARPVPGSRRSSAWWPRSMCRPLGACSWTAWTWRRCAWTATAASWA